MKKLVSTLGLPREEWLACRKKGIGGSDAGAVCGLNPYRSAISVYYDKTSGDTELIPDSESMRIGRDLEQYVAERFCEATGKKVRRANALYCNEEHPFMLADFDRMVVGEDAGLECKTASPYAADQWADGNIPLSYQLQCYHYMAVTGYSAWYIAVLIFGKEFKYYKLSRDPELEKDLVRIEKQFWEGYVIKNRIPEPDGSAEADKLIAAHFAAQPGKKIDLVGFDMKLRRRQELIDAMSRMDTEKKKIDQELKLYMKEAEIAEDSVYRVTWKQVVSQRLDTDKLKTERPDIYQEYTKETQYRRLTVSAA